MVASFLGTTWWDNETDGKFMYPEKQANPTQAELPQVIVPQAISEPEGVSDASNAAATDFVRSNAVIGQTVRDLESLASELRGNDPIGLTAPEYENPNQYVTLPPLEKIDWSNVKFNDLVDLESDASSVEFETSRTEARVFANRSGQSDTAVEQDEVVATQKNESSTLSKLWALVRAYGGLRQK